MLYQFALTISYGLPSLRDTVEVVLLVAFLAWGLAGGFYIFEPGAE